jgi:DNA anti-recombination protein RmuC
MELSENQLMTIGQYVKSHLDDWLGTRSPQRAVYDPALMERMVRVEEELKHQRELMIQGFQRMDNRFEMMQNDMNKRFEQVDRRFEQIQTDMNKRFEQVDKRFEQVDKRFEQITKRIDRFMIWSFGVTIAVGGIVIAVLR